MVLECSIKLKKAKRLRELNDSTKLKTHTNTSKNAVQSALMLPTLRESHQSSVIVLDMVPSLMLTDAHFPGSSHLFIYLFICVNFIY